MKRYVLTGLGIASVVVGTIGLVLPVLPTTPFLLLAAALFLRSSKRLHDWLMGHPVYGQYIKSYLIYKGIRKEHKIFAISTLWLTISISVILVEPIWLKILLFAIASAVTVHILSFKTLSKKEIEALNKNDNDMA